MTCREPRKNGNGVQKQSDDGAGARLIVRLQQALLNRQSPLDFAVSEINCMAGCDRPCALAYQADGKATYLFGDIDPDGSIDALVEFADQYAGLDDGWCRATERPRALLHKTIARIPALECHSPSRPTTGDPPIVGTKP